MPSLCSDSANSYALRIDPDLSSDADKAWSAVPVVVGLHKYRGVQSEAVNVGAQGLPRNGLARHRASESQHLVPSARTKRDATRTRRSPGRDAAATLLRIAAVRAYVGARAERLLGGGQRNIVRRPSPAPHAASLPLVRAEVNGCDQTAQQVAGPA